jgi:hypothetical protein
MFLHVADDPERDLRVLTPYMLCAINQYRSWQFPNSGAMGEIPAQFAVTSEEDLRRSAHYRIVTPDECVDLVCALPSDGVVIIRPMWGGFSPGLGWSSLRLINDQVIPRVRERLGSSTAPATT